MHGAPAERADVIVDFTKFAGQTLVMKNHKPQSPFSNPAPQLPQVMQIRIGTTVSRPGPTSIPSSLLGGRAAIVTGPIAATRYITLNEIDVDEPTWFLNLNGLHFEDAVTETPQVGTVEDWVYINVTGDTHPMHTHLVTFQVIGRTPSPAGTIRPRLRRDQRNRPTRQSAVLRTRSKPIPATSPGSGPNSICRLA